ncbi:MAG: DeoR/GlpR transcriptional regulator [Clostridia bacterium]|nr:DeoR/GlpR transcriptional regulator [Clostridia bacterium]
MAESKLKIDIRRNKILDELKSSGKVFVSELSKKLGVTPVTVRNDLQALENDGYLIRMNGGAVYSSRTTEKPGIPHSLEISQAHEKEAVAEVISEMIKDGDTLFINSGTTTQLVASKLKKRNNLNIVTNSLEVATMLGNVASFRVILLGGEVNTKYKFTYGGDAQDQLSRYQADWAIMAIDGISMKNGITTYHAEEAIIDRMMMRGAKSVIIAADRTKIGRAGFMKVCDCNESITLVTNKEGSMAELSEFYENEISVIEA